MNVPPAAAARGPGAAGAAGVVAGRGAVPRPADRASRGTVRAAPAAGVALAALLAAPLCGCYAPQMMLLKSGLDSLRTQMDTLVVRDSIAYRVLEETRREVASQRDILLSTRATAGSTTQELFEQMGRLEAKLEEVMGRFQQITQRATPPPPAGPDPNQLYVFLDKTLLVRDTAHMNGWDYDPITNTITVYGKPCTDLKAGTAKVVDIVYGCPKAPPN